MLQGHIYIFVFCINRYGLPVNFQAMLLQPNKKNMKKLREVLYELYKHLDSSAAAIIDVGYVSVLRGLNTRNDLIFESSFFPVPAIYHGYSWLEPQPARVLSLRVLQNRLQPAGLQIEELLLITCLCVKLKRILLNSCSSPPVMHVHSYPEIFFIIIQSMTAGEYLYVPPLVLFTFFFKSLCVIIMCLKSFRSCFVSCIVTSDVSDRYYCVWTTVFLTFILKITI